MATYAVGLNKGWVEIRAADNPPQLEESQVERTVKLPRNIENPKTGGFGGEFHLVMKQKIHIGGRVLLTIPRTKFQALARLVEECECPKVGDSIRLTLAVAKQFRDPEWVKEKGLDKYV